MKEFNLEEAMAGKPVITRDGREVTHLTLFIGPDDKYPLLGVVRGKVIAYTKEGKYLDTCSTDNDLFMRPTKKLTGLK